MPNDKEPLQITLWKPNGVPLPGTGMALTTRDVNTQMASYGGFEVPKRPIARLWGQIVKPLVENAIVTGPLAGYQRVLQAVGALPKTRQEALRRTSGDLLDWNAQAASIEANYQLVVNDTTGRNQAELIEACVGEQTMVDIFGGYVRDKSGQVIANRPGVRIPELPLVAVREHTSSFVQVSAISQPTDGEEEAAVRLANEIAKGRMNPRQCGPFIDDVFVRGVDEVLKTVGNDVALRRRHMESEKHVVKTITLIHTTPGQQFRWGVFGGAGFPIFQAILGGGVGADILFHPANIYDEDPPLKAEYGKEPDTIDVASRTAVHGEIVNGFEGGFLPRTSENSKAKPTKLTKLAAKIHGPDTEQLPIGSVVFRGTGTNYTRKVAMLDPRGFYHTYDEFRGRWLQMYGWARGKDGVDGKQTEERFRDNVLQFLERTVMQTFPRAGVITALASQKVMEGGGVELVVTSERPDEVGSTVVLNVFDRSGDTRVERKRYYEAFKALDNGVNSKRLRKVMGGEAYEQLKDDLDYVEKVGKKEDAIVVIKTIMENQKVGVQEATRIMITRYQYTMQRLYGDIDVAEAEVRRTATT